MNEQDIEKLLKAAGPLVKSDENMMNDIRSEVENTWLEVVAKRKARRYWVYSGSMAASIVALTMLVLSLQISIFDDKASINGAQIAQVVMFDGSGTINDSGLHHGRTLVSGDHIQTESGHLTIQLYDQTLVVLSANTDLTLSNHNTLQLTAGKIYLDSPDINTSVTVITPWGNVRDIGTQYEVAVSANELQLAMRSGKVVMELDDKTLYASVFEGLGDVVSVDTNNDIQKSTMSPSDPYWSWTHKALSDFDVNNQSVFEVLEWVHRVTGKNIVFATDDVQRLAHETTLAGGKLSPAHVENSLPMLLGSTLLSAKIMKEDIIIQAR